MTTGTGNYGLSPNGLIVPSTLQVLNQINADQAASPALDPNINTSPDSIQGQENGVVADAAEQVWQVLQVAYNAFNPDACEDFLLDALSALTGTLRQPATPSKFDGGNYVWVGLAPNTTIAPGTVFTQLGNASNQYKVVLGVSSPVGAPDQFNITGVASGVFSTSTDLTNYAQQSVIFTSSGTLPSGTDTIVNTVYYISAAGLTSSSFKVAASPGGAVLDVNPGTGSLKCTFAYALIECDCTTAGPIPCNPFTLALIATPVTGLYCVANPSAAFIGTDQDTDPQLRLRRESELRASGSGTLPAMQASLLAIEVAGLQPVLAVEMFENTKDVFDFTLGLPPHSFLALVNDFLNSGSGETPAVPNEVIARTIWNNKPMGIAPIGNTSGTFTDDDGIVRVVPFSRPSLLELGIHITINVVAGVYDASNVPAQIAVVGALGQNVVAGGKVRFSWFFTALATVDGIDSVESVNIQGAGNNVDFQLLLYQTAWMQTSDVTVTAIPV